MRRLARTAARLAPYAAAYVAVGGAITVALARAGVANPVHAHQQVASVLGWPLTLLLLAGDLTVPVDDEGEDDPALDAGIDEEPWWVP